MGKGIGIVSIPSSVKGLLHSSSSARLSRVCDGTSSRGGKGRGHCPEKSDAPGRGDHGSKIQPYKRRSREGIKVIHEKQMLTMSQGAAN